MTNQQTEKLFITYIDAIMKRCADHLDISVDALRHAYNTMPEVREDLDGIFQRHIDSLGKAA
jgi:hypothetical protein